MVKFHNDLEVNMIHLSKETIPMMLDVIDLMNQGKAYEEDLMLVLSHPDYEMEFERYANHEPETRFSKEEFIDFFKNIRNLNPEDIKPRGLKYRHEHLLYIMDNVPHYRKVYDSIKNYTIEDVLKSMEKAHAGLPNHIRLEDFKLIFNIGVGASGGYAYRNFSQYDLKMILDGEDSLSLSSTIAHECHHLGFDKYIQSFQNQLVNNLQEMLLVYLSGEGTAIKYCNNFHGHLTKKLYPDETMDVDTKSYDYYMENFEALMAQLKIDLSQLEDGTPEMVGKMYMEHYFYRDVTLDGHMHENYLSQPVCYFLGADIFGLLHDIYGKEKVFQLMQPGNELLKAINDALVIYGRPELTF